MAAPAAAVAPSPWNPEGLTAAAWARLYGPADGALLFYRAEDRRTVKHRVLDCGCRIDRGDPYLYIVSKGRGIPGVEQTRLCDSCRRLGNHY